MAHMQSSHQKFPKQERLTNKKIIEELFSKGSSVYVYPFRILYLATQTSAAVHPQVLFSVSKRNFKKAVDRNLIKRRMREAYRLHRSELIPTVPEDKKPSYIAFIYIAKEKISFEILEKKLILAWKRLVNN